MPEPQQAALSHGHGGFCARSHCSTSSWLQYAALLHTPGKDSSELFNVMAIATQARIVMISFMWG